MEGAAPPFRATRTAGSQSVAPSRERTSTSDPPAPARAATTAASRARPYGSWQPSKQSRVAPHSCTTAGRTVSGAPRATTRREPRLRREASRSARDSRRKERRTRPTRPAAGSTNHGSRQKRGRRAHPGRGVAPSSSVASSRAARRAGLSWSRRPLRNQRTERTGGGGILGTCAGAADAVCRPCGARKRRATRLRRVDAMRAERKVGVGHARIHRKAGRLAFRRGGGRRRDSGARAFTRGLCLVQSISSSRLTAKSRDKERARGDHGLLVEPPSRGLSSLVFGVPGRPPPGCSRPRDGGRRGALDHALEQERLQGKLDRVRTEDEMPRVRFPWAAAAEADGPPRPPLLGPRRRAGGEGRRCLGR